MKTLINNTRYETLMKQFHLNKSMMGYKKIVESNERLFQYVYHYTDIYYLDHIEPSTLYDYISYHMCKSYNQMTFTEIIKDIKHFVFFLKHIREYNQIPTINLSLNRLTQEINTRIDDNQF